uniref:WAP domain-containing protein n=1 Tax=Strigamia maritima TaxID=126957 RepID=T1J7A1_STRMM
MLHYKYGRTLVPTYCQPTTSFFHETHRKMNCKLIFVVLVLAITLTLSNQQELKPVNRLSSLCPGIMPMQDWVCEMGRKPGAWNKCSSHSQCLGGMICCLNGCGVRVCQFPVL